MIELNERVVRTPKFLVNVRAPIYDNCPIAINNPENKKLYRNREKEGSLQTSLDLAFGYIIALAKSISSP